MGYARFKSKCYKIIEENLGKGSFGITKLLRDYELDELFVCKKYKPQPNLDKISFYDNFKKEIKIMYKINHPNVVRVFDYYLYNSEYTGYIIMEYINGINIKEWFEHHNSDKSSINNIFRQLIEGFSCIEENGIVHRDIRESNILISNDGRVKIIDFGLGKYIDNYNISLDSFNEIINRADMVKIPNEFSQKKYTSKTDMFCIAELFERMLKNYNIKDFEYIHILQRMLQINPNDRYDSFNDILTELDKKEFKKLEISEEDKSIYNDFVQSLFDTISVYLGTKKFEANHQIFIEGVREILDKNRLNYYIGNTPDLIRVFVKCKFKYYSKRKISVESLQKFYDWMMTKDIEFQKIILKNIISRLSFIHEEEEIELPF